MSIRLKPTSQEAVVAMTHTGRGIATSDLLHIFASFATPAAVGPGTGSGLSLCQSLIKHHPGAIEVESA